MNFVRGYTTILEATQVCESGLATLFDFWRLHSSVEVTQVWRLQEGYKKLIIFSNGPRSTVQPHSSGQVIFKFHVCNIISD